MGAQNSNVSGSVRILIGITGAARLLVQRNGRLDPQSPKHSSQNIISVPGSQEENLQPYTHHLRCTESDALNPKLRNGTQKLVVKPDLWVVLLGTEV